MHDDGRDEPHLHEEALRAAGFGPVDRQVFAHAVGHTAETLVELIKTRSYYLTASPDRQAEIVAGVLSLATTHPDLAGRGVFQLPYRTVVLRTALS